MTYDEKRFNKGEKDYQSSEENVSQRFGEFYAIQQLQELRRLEQEEERLRREQKILEENANKTFGDKPLLDEDEYNHYMYRKEKLNQFNQEQEEE